MKKAIIAIIILFFLLVLYLKEGRTFYKFSDGKCVTVWVTTGRKCYLISGKYYGLSKPKNDYILLSTDSYFSIINDTLYSKKLCVIAIGTFHNTEHAQNKFIYYDRWNEDDLNKFNKLFCHTTGYMYDYNNNFEYYTIELQGHHINTNVK